MRKGPSECEWKMPQVCGVGWLRPALCGLGVLREETLVWVGREGHFRTLVPRRLIYTVAVAHRDLYAGEGVAQGRPSRPKAVVLLLPRRWESL